jgi:hypothetical protein
MDCFPVVAVNASHTMARFAPLMPATEVFADLRDSGSVRTARTLPVVGSPINLAADADRIGTRLTLDNVVSDADHLLATHRDSFADSIAYEAARYGIETSILMPGPFVDGTAHFPNAEFPKDMAVQEAYRSVYGDALDRNEAATRSIFPKKIVADVQAIADEALRIVELPHGQRPYRSCVDFTDFGDRQVNEVAEKMRERLMTRFGFADMLHPHQPAKGREILS